jgi:L-2-hydroxycarboxylate dehydrogenase (NAD+)
VKVSIADLTKKMTSLLRAKGVAEADIPFVINMYLGGELRGHISHGLASFSGFIAQDFSKVGEPEVIKETHSLFMIDAKGNSGNIVGRLAADEAIKRANKEVVGLSIIKNMESWLRPGAVAEYIAGQGLVAVVINNGGEAAVAPPGGFDPVTGTNPIAYGIPTVDDTLVVDMATSKRAKGEIRLANKYGTKLPPDSFYDSEGNVTIDPKVAYSIMPFGDYKGFSLALLVEVLCGSLLSMPMMLKGDPSNNAFGGYTPKRGGMIIVIDPSQTSGLDEFKKANAEFIAKIKATRPRKGSTIRIPGIQAGVERSVKLQNGEVEIPDELWEEIKAL